MHKLASASTLATVGSQNFLGKTNHDFSGMMDLHNSSLASSGNLSKYQKLWRTLENNGNSTLNKKANEKYN